jgi:Fe-S-cluster-containing hydrogenase component 2/CRP-like cAMP-binding protein
MNTVAFAAPAPRHEEELPFVRNLDGQLVRLDEPTAQAFDAEVRVTFDGDDGPVVVPRAVPRTDHLGTVLRDRNGQAIPRATTIYDAAVQRAAEKRGTNPIPILCHQPHLDPVAVCRVCSVLVGERQGDGSVKYGRRLVPACQHRVEERMVVQTRKSPDAGHRARVEASVRTVVELLATDHLATGHPFDANPHNELAALAREFGVERSRFARRESARGADDSSPVIAVNHDACILCDRCVRGCNVVRRNFVIGRTGKGPGTRIGFDLDTPMGRSSCVECGECLISCPTSALTALRQVSAPPAPGPGIATPVSPEELKRDPLFGPLPYKLLTWMPGAVVRRELARDEELFREGEYGSAAYRVDSGQLKGAIRSPRRHARNGRPDGLLSRMMGHSILGQLSRGGGASAAPAYSIRTDAHSTTGAGESFFLAGPGTLLGEETCLNHYPRPATVAAVRPTVVTEVRRNALLALLRHPATRRRINESYRDRALRPFLERLWPFAGAEARGSALAAALAARIDPDRDFMRLEPDQELFRQGEPASDLWLVRLGFLKLTQGSGRDAVTVDYVGPQGVVGLVGLMSALSAEVAALLQPRFAAGSQPTNCTAKDHVELVRIPGDVLAPMLRGNAELLRGLTATCRQIIERQRPREAGGHGVVEGYVEQGLYHARSLLVLDLEKCTRCDECTKACADSHGGVTRLIREGLRFGNYLVTTSCRSCLDPLCMIGCPVDAIHRTKHREVRIEDWCVGCGLCARTCPYGNIHMVGWDADGNPAEVDPADPLARHAAASVKATTCDLCQDLVGPGDDPSCVYSCPHDAAHRMNGRKLLKLVPNPPAS